MLVGFSFSLKAQDIPMYEYYNTKTHLHFYTTSATELGSGGNGWVQNGILGYVEAYPANQVNPIYRYYQSTSGAHYYTITPNAVPDGFVYESIIGCAAAPPIAVLTEVYEFFNSSNGDYYYSTSTTVPSGYKLNGGKFYVTND
ncbi:hypothetical protein HDF24_24830 [Mucilaginibacter sp. X4EP1]|uniref:hypothetical protein n=1 Tax=Mucilaginibacter sp. X4EP1 TaxID=2723092 RepID=UPI002167E151|nr:hypothetical protein [Mucilaginibacter sp. X4EP1]MCS3815165.1 hypothetical protein [Mucilaginibacter sp. X4EP1]